MLQLILLDEQRIEKDGRGGVEEGEGSRFSNETRSDRGAKKFLRLINRREEVVWWTEWVKDRERFGIGSVGSVR